MPTTWILVADQARARLFSLASDQGDPTEIAAFTNPEGRMRAHDLERGRHPRVHERLGEASHAIDPRSTPQRKSATRFAAQLRSMLEHAWADHACDSLALIAPPRAQGANTSAGASNMAAGLTTSAPVRAATSRAAAPFTSATVRRAPAAASFSAR